jgi:hypothetical protein
MLSVIKNDKDKEKKKAKEEEEEEKPAVSTITQLKSYMSNSSLFCLNKRTKFRKLLIRIALGGIKQPNFTTVDQLVDYYTQKID